MKQFINYNFIFRKFKLVRRKKKYLQKLTFQTSLHQFDSSMNIIII